MRRRTIVLSTGAAVVLPDGTLGPRYDKHHLVPFGEYMPLWPVLRHLGLPQFTAGPGMAAGPGPRTLALPGVPPSGRRAGAADLDRSRHERGSR